jgi:hypothetical protein
MGPRSLRPLRGAVAFTLIAALAACVLSGVGGEGLLCVAPALLLAMALLRRRYPGERLLTRLASVPPARALKRAPALHAPADRSAGIPRGGLLLGFALAVRPPPGAAHAS